MITYRNVNNMIHGNVNKFGNMRTKTLVSSFGGYDRINWLKQHFEGILSPGNNIRIIIISPTTTDIITKVLRTLNIHKYFDLIIGSDVAYRDYLHEPLIDALKEFSSSSSSSSSSTTSIIPTVSLIGITMNDTKPIFFQKLIQAGFQYEKLAEHLFDTEYNTCSRQFGIFAITRTSSQVQ